MSLDADTFGDLADNPSKMADTSRHLADILRGLSDTSREMADIPLYSYKRKCPA